MILRGFGPAKRGQNLACRTHIYVNPLTDFGFKRLFGTEPNKMLLIDFLNVLLPERHRIEE
jgi:hypothetical protein